MPTVQELLDEAYGRAPTIGLTAGPVEEVPPGGTIGMRDVSSASELPFLFRLKVQFARQNPKELANVLNSQGFELEPAVEGRMIARSPEGKRYALDEFMAGPAAVQYGPKLGLYGALAAGPQAGLGALLGRSALGSLAGTAAETGTRKLLGLSAGTTPGGVAEETGINMLADLLMRGTGGALRTLTGAGRARRAYQETIAEATMKHTAKIADITERVRNAQATANQFLLKAGEREAAQIGKEQVRQEFASAFGMSLDDLAKLKTEGLEELSTRTGRVKTALGNASRSVMAKIGQGYEQTLKPYAETEIDASNFVGVGKTIRGWLTDRMHEPSRAFEALLQDLDELGGKPGPVTGVATPRGKPLTFTKGATTVGERERLMQLLEPRVTSAAEANVEQARGLVTKLRGFATSATSPMEAKMATQAADAVQESIAAVLPEEVQTTLKGLDAQWFEANKLIGRKFRAGVRNASNPAQVADVLIGSGVQRPLGVERAHALLNEVTADELPPVRAAVIERILRAPSPEKYATTIDETLMKRLFKGTGLEDPQQFVKAINGAYRLETLVRDPKYMDRLAQAAQRSFESAIGKKRMASLQAIEDDAMAEIRGLMSPEAQAREAARSAAQRAPSFLRWFGHHAAYRGGMLLLGGGAYFNNPELWIVAPFLLGRAGLEHFLSDPKFSKTYLNMVLSPTVERQGFLLGRLAAGALGEYGKTIKRAVEAPASSANTLAAPEEE